MIKRQMAKTEGCYMRHLRAKENLTVQAFSDKLGVTSIELRDMEDGKTEIPENIIEQLSSISEDEDMMDRVFGERYWHALSKV